MNEAVENIGARRLQTVMEKLLEDVSFEAEDRSGETVVVDAAYVERQLAEHRRRTPISAGTCCKRGSLSRLSGTKNGLPIGVHPRA